MDQRCCRGATKMGTLASFECVESIFLSSVVAARSADEPLKGALFEYLG